MRASNGGNCFAILLLDIDKVDNPMSLSHFVSEYNIFSSLIKIKNKTPLKHKLNCQSDQILNLILKRNEIKKLIRDRLVSGFYHPSHEFDNTIIKEIHFKGLMSDHHDIAKRFVHATHIKTKLLTGDKKDQVFKSESKLLSLDSRYVTLNKTVRAAFRIDFDHSFESPEAFLIKLAELKLPCMPHATCGTIDIKGRYKTPHAWFLLPEKSHVWYDRENPRCSKGIMNFYDYTHRNLVEACKPLGADPGCLSNPMHGKNPLSPLWHTCFPNINSFPNMTEWRQWFIQNKIGSIPNKSLKTEINRNNQSNHMFDYLRKLAFHILKDWHINQTLIYRINLQNRKELGEDLYHSLAAQLNKNSTEKELKLARKIAHYAAIKWDPEKIRKKRPCHAKTIGISVHKAQSIGGQYTNLQRKRKSIIAIATAIETLQKNTKDISRKITKKAVADLCKLHINTVSRHWNCAINWIKDQNNDKNQCTNNKTPKNDQKHTNRSPYVKRLISGNDKPKRKKTNASQPPRHKQPLTQNNEIAIMEIIRYYEKTHKILSASKLRKILKTTIKYQNEKYNENIPIQAPINLNKKAFHDEHDIKQQEMDKAWPTNYYSRNAH